MTRATRNEIRVPGTMGDELGVTLWANGAETVVRLSTYLDVGDEDYRDDIDLAIEDVAVLVIALQAAIRSAGKRAGEIG